MSVEMLRNTKTRVIGAKQVIKAVEKNSVSLVYVAEDADMRITQPIKELCDQRGIEVETMPTMIRLGRACGIEVGAAAVAVVVKWS